MIDENHQFDRYLSQYDDLAVDLLDSTHPNVAFGLSWSNQEMTQNVLEDMGWDSFDLFMPIDYAAAYDSPNPEVIRSHYFIAFLRMILFIEASQQNIGNADFNSVATAHSEYWFKRLYDRYNSLLRKEESAEHNWIN